MAAMTSLPAVDKTSLINDLAWPGPTRPDRTVTPMKRSYLLKCAIHLDGDATRPRATSQLAAPQPMLGCLAR